MVLFLKDQSCKEEKLKTLYFGSFIFQFLMYNLFLNVMYILLCSPLPIHMLEWENSLAYTNYWESKKTSFFAFDLKVSFLMYNHILSMLLLFLHLIWSYGRKKMCQLGLFFSLLPWFVKILKGNTFIIEKIITIQVSKGKI